MTSPNVCYRCVDSLPPEGSKRPSLLKEPGDDCHNPDPEPPGPRLRLFVYNCLSSSSNPGVARGGVERRRGGCRIYFLDRHLVRDSRPFHRGSPPSLLAV